MITLHQFAPAYGHYSASPFAAKVEAYFQLAGVDYKTAPANPIKAPRGKIPYIRTADGELMGDSSLIINWCKANFGDALDSDLTSDHHAQGHVLKRLVEEHLYWSFMYSRFEDPGGWVAQKAVVQTGVPAPLKPVVGWFARREVRRNIHGQGLGRHDAEAVYRAGIDDLDVLQTLLDDGDFVVGSAPTTYDCSVWSMLRAILVTPTANLLTSEAQKMTALVAYKERVEARIAAAVAS